MKRRSGMFVALAAVIGSLLPAAASPPVVLPMIQPLHWDGSALRDPAGREVTLRGLEVAAAESAPDADRIASWGFNLVRLGLTWREVEPARGRYDRTYLAAVKSIVHTLASRGIYTLIHFRQDLYHERYGGEGAPDWAVGSPLPPVDTGGGPAGYLTPAVTNEYDLFWGNASGVRDAYADAWMRVAAELSGEPGVLGYDLFGAPWPGSQWPSCTSSAGCPAFDDVILDRFYRQVLGGIRTIDADAMIYVSPAIPASLGAGTWVGPVDDPSASTGLSFRVTCPARPPDHGPAGSGGACGPIESRAMRVQSGRARAVGAHPMLSGVAANGDPASAERLFDLAEVHGVYSFAYDAGGEASLAADHATLKVVARPYAQSVAGTLFEQDWMPDEMLRTLRLVYRANGGDTVVVWPRAIQGEYGAGVVCNPPGHCSVTAAGDRIVVHAAAGAHVIFSASRLD
ncbi:MAG TPA: cellulase family glycosylhydrolase [Actinomycetota bacterium]|nr:cellulase family glycosylhydrolase [Actinomycetota bacterium]